MVDALASGSEERRDKLRKVAGIGKYEMIRKYLNGVTRHIRCHSAKRAHPVNWNILLAGGRENK